MPATTSSLAPDLSAQLGLAAAESSRASRPLCVTSVALSEDWPELSACAEALRPSPPACVWIGSGLRLREVAQSAN